MAWEIRVSAAPDFRPHPSLGFGCLYFVNWEILNVSAQTHQKIPSNLKSALSDLDSRRKRFGREFEGNLSSEKVSLKKNKLYLIIKQKASRIPKKAKFMTEKRTMYFFAQPGLWARYSRKVMRLAREAINVPQPPMFTP